MTIEVFPLWSLWTRRALVLSLARSLALPLADSQFSDSLLTAGLI